MHVLSFLIAKGKQENSFMFLPLQLRGRNLIEVKETCQSSDVFVTVHEYFSEELWGKKLTCYKLRVDVITVLDVE